MHSGGSMLLQKQGKENVFFHEQPYQILVVVITVKLTHIEAQHASCYTIYSRTFRI